MRNKYNRTKEKQLTKELQIESQGSAIRCYQIAFYDTFVDGGDLICFDEAIYPPDKAEVALSYLQYANERLRVFVKYEDGIEIELLRGDDLSGQRYWHDYNY